MSIRNSKPQHSILSQQSKDEVKKSLHPFPLNESPSCLLISPVSKLLNGDSKNKPSQKECAKVLFANRKRKLVQDFAKNDSYAYNRVFYANGKVTCKRKKEIDRNVVFIDRCDLSSQSLDWHKREAHKTETKGENMPTHRNLGNIDTSIVTSLTASKNFQRIWSPSENFYTPKGQQLLAKKSWHLLPLSISKPNTVDENYHPEIQRSVPRINCKKLYNSDEKRKTMQVLACRNTAIPK